MNARIVVSRWLLPMPLLLALPLSSWAQELSNDAFVTAEITRVGQIDQYEFDATAGDVVYLNVADRDNTSLFPTVTVFDPSGSVMASDAGSVTAEVFGLEITVSGRHVVRVQDSGANDLGFYTVNFARAPGANEGGRLPDDARVPGVLELGDLDTFTFEASIGERVHLNVGDVDNTSLFPVLVLIDPVGDVFASDSGSRAATLRDIEIDATGVWTVVLADSGSNDAGNYELFFARVPGANERGLLPNDARRAASLAVGDIDTWTFDAEPGDRLFLTIADVNNTSFFPDLLVYGPDGALLYSDSDSLAAFMNGVEASSAGRFTAVVRDSGANDAGDYELHFARAPGAAEGGTLVGNAALAGTLELGDIDTFEFGAREGANVTVNVGDTDNTSLFPVVQLFDATGALVASDSASLAASIALSVPADGFYTLVVHDSGANDAGNYTLDFFYAGATPPARTRGVVLEPNVWHLLGVPGATGGTIGELFGTILDPGDYATSDGTWILYGFEPGTASADASYRVLDLSEPVPQGTGFWFLHLGDTALRLNLPASASDAAGTMGGGCASGSSCVTTPLASSSGGGWTIGAVPSTLSPGVDTFRVVTDGNAPDCTGGCTPADAFAAGYVSPNGVWTYEQSTGTYRRLSAVDSVAPWTGFWIRTNAPAGSATPELRLPVR